MNKKKVLIVEDEKSLLNALVDKCQSEDFEVITAEDGEKAYEVADEHQPDLILLDIMMPKVDGIEFLRKMRKTDWGSKAEVILLTNVTDSSRIAEAMQEGVYDYYIKSDIKIEEIADVVKIKLGIA